jgi:hypothetical protein
MRDQYVLSISSICSMIRKELSNTRKVPTMARENAFDFALEGIFIYY